MKRTGLLPLFLLAGVAACARGGGNVSANSANIAVEEGDLDSAIGGDEISPIPEAEDDMSANKSGGPNLAGNISGDPTTPSQPTLRLPTPGQPPQGR